VECFAADDIFCNYISEAARIVEEGIATPAQVDRIVNDAIGGGGPFNVMDATRGNLLTVKCQLLMKDAPTGSAWFSPPAILEQKGNAAWHDRKSPGDPRSDEATKKIVLDRILAVLLARTYFVADNDICAPADLDWLTRMALGFRSGLLSLAEELGAERVHALCTDYAVAHPGFSVPKSIADERLVDFRRNVRVEREGMVGIVRVWRPEVKNALSAQTIAEIDSAFDELGADDAIRGIVFTSYDGSLAGADINELASLKTPADCTAICLKTHPVQAKIEASKKPVVAAVDGAVMGGGAEFCMACHARVVGKRLVMAQPEVNLGIIPGYGGSQRLPRLIGLEKANEVLRAARVVSAKEACAWGWAHGEPVADPEAEAKALIDKQLAGDARLGPVDPKPMSVPKELPPVDIGHRSLAIDAILVDVMKRGLALPLEAGLRIEAEAFGACHATVDMDIGMKNFVQNGPRVPALFLHE
jgi:enoyl-CoA hydratase / 3-hydroxyacyl-CoA dehydrogenase